MSTSSATVTLTPAGNSNAVTLIPPVQLNGQARERRYRARPVEVVLLCSCGAELPPPREGMSAGFGPTEWTHVCLKCGERTVDVRQSGEIVWERKRRVD